MDSTKQKIKKECLSRGPKDAVGSISADTGGILLASAPGLLPRNEKQVTNFKAKASSSRSSTSSNKSQDAATDSLFVIMQQAYSDDPCRKYVRAVNAAPEPAIVVATDSQLNNLARFCTSSHEFSPLTVDPTFSLGAFDVTLITYRHLFLQSKRYKHSPVFIGPACIHY